MKKISHPNVFSKISHSSIPKKIGDQHFRKVLYMGESFQAYS